MWGKWEDLGILREKMGLKCGKTMVKYEDYNRNMWFKYVLRWFKML